MRLPPVLKHRLHAYAERLEVVDEVAAIELLDWALGIHENVVSRLEHRENKIAAATSMAMRALRSEGKYTGGRAPFGYRLAADGEKLEPNEAEQAIIAEARALRAAGMSFRDVAATLDERGIKSRSGQAFGLTQIARMLAEAPF